ncbi:MAG TPA: hypothetical protein VF476_09605 [Chitinophagaceae bacterium]
MKHFLILLLLSPLWGKTQTKDNCFTIFLNKNWEVAKAVNILDSNDVVYAPADNIKTWDIGSNSIYRLSKDQIALVDGAGNVDLGTVDSISINRFVVHVTSPNGYRSIYEYYNIQFSKNTLIYSYRKWNYTTNTNERHLHYGYSAICQLSKKTFPKPTLAQLEKKWGNKISFVFTAADGNPVANKEVKIIIPVNGQNMVTYVYTDARGFATNYYKDDLFDSNKHITMFIEYGNLSASAVVEKKHCPITLKRALKRDRKEDLEKISIGN